MSHCLGLIGLGFYEKKINWLSSKNRMTCKDEKTTNMISKFFSDMFLLQNSDILEFESMNNDFVKWSH